MFCTSWLNLAKNDNVSDKTRCTTLGKFALKCFDFYNGVAVTSGTELSNSVDEDTLVSYSIQMISLTKIYFRKVEAVNFLEKPCINIIDKSPPLECISKDFIGWQSLVNSCSKACRSSKDECCASNCVFQEHGLLVDGNLNKTLLTSWFSRTNDVKDPRVMAYINHCEAIGTYIHCYHNRKLTFIFQSSLHRLADLTGVECQVVPKKFVIALSGYVA